MTDDDRTTEHTTHHADLGDRDRAQPNRLETAANLRPDGDAHPDEDEREALLEQVEGDEGEQDA